MGLPIIYLDDILVVINKPKGLPMTNSNFYPTSLVDIVRQTGLETYSPAHLLDMCTSGLVVGGLSRSARGNLNGQFYRREVAKYYVAALDGTIDEHGVVDAPLLCIPGNMTRVSSEGKPAKTEYWALGSEADLNYALFRIYTGRTHQIRAHALELGAPIHEDPKYNPNPGKGQFLHSAYLGFTHPESGTSLEFMVFPEWLPDRFKEYASTIIRSNVPAQDQNHKLVVCRL